MDLGRPPCRPPSRGAVPRRSYVASLHPAIRSRFRITSLEFTKARSRPIGRHRAFRALHWPRLSPPARPAAARPRSVNLVSCAVCPPLHSRCAAAAGRRHRRVIRGSWQSSAISHVRSTTGAEPSESGGDHPACSRDRERRPWGHDSCVRSCGAYRRLVQRRGLWRTWKQPITTTRSDSIK